MRVSAGSKPIIARCVLQENEDGNDDNQFLPSSQTRDHFLVCCLVRLLAHPKLERGRPLLFRARLRPFRDADCRSTFLGWSRHWPWGTIHSREAAAHLAEWHRGRSLSVLLPCQVR